MYCVSLQLVRQCNPQRDFSCRKGVDSFFPCFTRQKCRTVSDPFLYRAKNLEFLGLLALFFCAFFSDNMNKENL